MVFMEKVLRHWVSFVGSLAFLAVILFSSALPFRATQSQAEPKAAATSKKISAEALRLNTLGVAYMNQGKNAEAQKHFEQALAADANFAQARMNLGISLLAQQKLEQARAALEEASSKLPEDPYAWYNLGLAYKDSAEPEKAIAAFQHVEKIVPDEPDAFYFVGFLFSQLQKYDEAIVAFKKALAIAPYHASAQFGLARAYQRQGDADSAREGMKHFQKLTSEHLGTPFGAGYGDQGKFSLAEFVHGAGSTAPAEIPVRYTAKPLAEITSAAKTDAAMTKANAATATGWPMWPAIFRTRARACSSIKSVPLHLSRTRVAEELQVTGRVLSNAKSVWV